MFPHSRVIAVISLLLASLPEANASLWKSNDFSAYVYLGMVTEDDPHFKLDEKSIDELQRRFFGPGLGFRHTIEAINHHGVAGFRLTGTHRFNATNYSIVIDMFESNGKVYEVAGLSKDEINPMKDPDIRSFMDSFQIGK